MKNLCLGILGPLLVMGCTTASEHGKINVKTSPNDKCRIISNKLLKGQIRYFDGMNLRLPSCPIINKWEFARYDPPVARKIWSALDLNPAEPEGGFLYANIEFYASTLADGTVVINRVEKAELTENSIYD